MSNFFFNLFASAEKKRARAKKGKGKNTNIKFQNGAFANMSITDAIASSKTPANHIKDEASSSNGNTIHGRSAGDEGGGGSYSGGGDSGGGGGGGGGGE